VELNANVVPPPTSQLPAGNNDAAVAAAPALSCGDDEYDPDVEYDPDLDIAPAVQGSCAPASNPPSQPPPPHRVHTVDSADAAAAAMVALEEHDIFAVDLEGVELGRGGTIAILQVTRLTFILPIYCLRSFIFCDIGCCAGCRRSLRCLHFRYSTIGS
jgi:hypothetical protein